VFALSYATMAAISTLFGGILAETPTDQVAIGVGAQPAV
jgi:hypothetical protein